MGKKPGILACGLLTVLLTLRPADALTKSVEPLNSGGQIDNHEASFTIPWQDSMAQVFYGDNGIDLFVDGVRSHLDTGFGVRKMIPAGDLDGDGAEDFLAYVGAPEYSPQVMAFSSADGRVLSTLRLTREGYDDSLGTVEQNSRVQQLYRGGDDSVLIVYDYSVIRVAPQDGTVLQRYDDQDNIWGVADAGDVDGDGAADVLFWGQNNVVGILSGADLQVLKSYHPCPTVQVGWNVSEMLPAVLNIWDARMVDGSIVAAGENGSLYFIDPATDETTELPLGVLSEEDLSNDLRERITYSGSGPQCVPNGVMSAVYQDFRIADVNEQYLMIDVMLGGVNSQTAPEGLINSAVILVDRAARTVALTIPLQNPGVVYEKTCFGTYQDQTVAAVLSDVGDGSARIVLYGTDGTVVSQKQLSSDVFSGGGKIEIRFGEEGWRLELFSHAVMTLSADLSQTTFSYQTTAASLLAVADGQPIVVFSTNGRKDRVVRYDTDLQTILWDQEVTMPYRNKGIEFIRYGGDYNRDGAADLFIILNEYNDQDSVSASDFRILSGSDGTVLYDSFILEESYYDYEKRTTVRIWLTADKLSLMPDVDGDGTPELVCGTQVVGSRKNTPIGSASGYVDASGNQLTVGDVNGDGIDDVVVIAAGETRLYLSRVRYSYGALEVSYTRTGTAFANDSSLNEPENSLLVGDIDGNGVREIGMIDRNSDGYEVYKIVSGATLATICVLCPEGLNDDGESFAISDYDVNHDGLKEIIGMDAGIPGVYDGATGTLLANISQWDHGDDGEIWDGTDGQSDYHPTDLLPFAEYQDTIGYVPFGDRDGDGISEIAYLVGTYTDGRSETWLAWASGADGSRLGHIVLNDGSGSDTLSAYNTRLVPVSGSQQIMLSGPSGSHSWLVDGETQTVTAGFAKTVKSACAASGDQLLIEDDDGALFRLDASRSFTLNSELPETLDDYRQTLQWESRQPYSVMTITDNGRVIYRGSGDSTAIELTAGTHTLVFSMDDGQGKSDRQTRTVTVAAQPVRWIPLAVLAAALAVAGFALGKGQKIRFLRRYRSVNGLAKPKKEKKRQEQAAEERKAVVDGPAQAEEGKESGNDGNLH